MDNGHFSLTQDANSHISSTPHFLRTLFTQVLSMTECLTSENLTKTVDGLSKVLSDTQSTLLSHKLNPSNIPSSSFNNNIIIGRF